jgi:hypothetical protein
MANAVTFTYKSVNYTLDFDRNTAVLLEQQGFKVENVYEKPNTYIPMLFYYAFAKYHRGIKRNFVDEIYEKMPKKQELVKALVELYLETGNSLFDEPEGDEGNLTWEQNG